MTVRRFHSIASWLSVVVVPMVLAAQPVLAQGAADCDSGELLDGDGNCVPTPVETDNDTKNVFVTSIDYTGALVSEAAALGFSGGTGLEAGDFICNDHAQSAGLLGSYVAWLSDFTTDAKDRLTAGSGPFVKLNGDLVAIDIGDLVDGDIANPIDVDETGAAKSGTRVWTATTNNGTGLESPSGYCGGWERTYARGLVGLASSADGRWTDAGAYPDCDGRSALYCFRE